MEDVLWCVLAAVPVAICLRYFRASVILCTWLYDLGLVFLRFGAFWAKATALVFCVLFGIFVYFWVKARILFALRQLVEPKQVITHKYQTTKPKPPPMDLRTVADMARRSAKKKGFL